MSKPRSHARSVNPNLGALGKSGLSKAVGKIIFETLMGADKGTSEARLTVERASASIAPAHLASLYPGDAGARSRMRALYETCLRTYREAIRPQDQASGMDDAGAALAYFVGAAMYALRGVNATREMIERLDGQLRGVARLSATLQAASVRDRQLYFETLATLGVLLAGTAAKAQGAAEIAQVQQPARGYLIELLGIDPALLVLDDNGLSLLPESHAA